LGYFECSLTLVYLAPFNESAKIKHAKIKQTPKNKPPKSAIVHGNEQMQKYK